MWMKIDDRLHAHRKTRKVIRSGDDKGRDIAPMGLWVIAGSWASQNGTDGWVPEHELDRWDDEWEPLAGRLVKAGYWWPEVREDEPGFGFVDWEDYNPVSNASARGSFGNHVRWHVNESVVNPDCEHCPQEPVDESTIAPESLSDRTATSAKGGDPDAAPVGELSTAKRGLSTAQSPGTAPSADQPHSPSKSPRNRGSSLSDRTAIEGDIAPDSLNIALPGPEPRPDPDPKDSCASTDVERDFEPWWAIYPRKRGKGQALKAYRAARKKASAETLLEALKAQRDALTKEGVGFCPYPATWLNGERWADEPDNVTELRADRPRRNGLAFVPTCPTCGAPPEDVHDPECPDQSWRPNTEGIGL